MSKGSDNLCNVMFIYLFIYLFTYLCIYRHVCYGYVSQLTLEADKPMNNEVRVLNQDSIAQ